MTGREEQNKAEGEQQREENRFNSVIAYNYGQHTFQSREEKGRGALSMNSWDFGTKVRSTSVWKKLNWKSTEARGFVR